MKHQVNIGSSITVPSYVLWFILGSWLGVVFLIIMTLLSKYGL